MVSNRRVRGLGYHYAQAFTELGHEVLFHGLEDVPWLTLRGRAAYRIKRLKPFIRVTEARQRKQLVKAAADFRPALAIFMGAAGWDAALIRQVKEMCEGRVVVLATDDPTVVPGLKSLAWLEGLGEFDTVFVPAKAAIATFYQLGAKRVATYGFSYNPKFHFPRAASGPYNAVAYLGSWGPLQEMWLDRIAAEFALRIYGWGWQHASRTSRARACWARGEGLEADMNAAIASSRIIFNMTRAEHGCTYSAKTLEIPACGGFMLTNWTPEQAELFEDGKECVFYNTMDDMLDKVRYYLENEAEREKIRRAGMQAVAPYTYKNSATSLLKLMGIAGTER